MADIQLIISSTVLYTMLFIVYGFTVFGIIGVVISENRNPVKSLAWVTVLLLLPVVGMIFYMFFGRSLKSHHMISRKNKRKLKRYKATRNIDLQNLDLSPESLQQIKLVHTLTGGQYFPGNDISIFVHGREKFDSLIKDLKDATEYIHLQYYIFENDNIGREISDILIEKAKNGVKVRVIYDHVGCFNVSSSFYKEMEESGVEVRPFMRVTFPQFATRINWRNHRKIVIIDGKIGYIGGMNIADRYIDGGSFPTWRDTHIRIFGEGVRGLQYSFAVDWSFIGEPLLLENCKTFNVSQNDDAGMQIMTSGPMGQWSNIALLLLKAISNAKKCIYIQSPYFLPTESLLKALQAAALSKVDVRLMIPDKSDSQILRLASRSYISECIRSGIKIYLYEAGMLHSKLIIVDNEFCTTGSTNFDFRSFEHNFEGNAFIYSKKINEQMREIFIEDQKSCRRINPTQWRHRPAIEKLKESTVRLLSPVL